MQSSSNKSLVYDVQAILDSALSVSLITVNLEGVITGFSRGSERMLGYLADEVIGKTTPLLFHKESEIIARGDELEIAQGVPIEGFEVFVNKVHENELEEREWTYIKKDGSHITVNLTVSELRDQDGLLKGYLGSSVDITERKRAEEALQQEKYFVDQLIMSLPGIFYLYDSDLRLRRWNRNHEKVLGYSAEEMDGRFLGDWHSGVEERSAAIKASRGIIDEGVLLDAVESTLRHKDGRNIPFLLSGVRVESASGPMLAGVGYDLTERKCLEEQLYQSQKMESIGLLAGGIAHDFNNILTAIMGNTDLGRRKAEPLSPVLKYFDNIMRVSESATSLTQQLLTFSRKNDIVPRIVDINQRIVDMVEMLRRLVGGKVELKIIQNTNLWLSLVDPSQLEQIILNLIVNARDAMPEGGTVSIEATNVCFKEERTIGGFESIAGEYIKISVSDTGMGMAPEVASRLFEPFYTTKDVGSGTGLGLAIIFSIVKQNHGFIDVHSTPGKGSCFDVFLPRVVVPSSN